MTDPTNPTPNLPAALSGLPETVASFLAGLDSIGDLPLEIACALSDEDLARLVGLISVVDEWAKPFRRMVGANLYQRRNDVVHGEWAGWVAAQAEWLRRSPKTLGNWMRDAEEHYQLSPPKGANTTRRQTARVSSLASDAIDTTAVEVPSPAPSLSIVPAAPTEPQVSAPAPTPRRTDDAVTVAVERLQAMLDVHPVVWAKVAQQWRTQVAAVASALATALEQTAPKELAVPKVNGVTPPRRQGTIKRGGPAALAAAPTVPANGACEHKGKRNVLPYATICLDCGSPVRR